MRISVLPIDLILYLFVNMKAISIIFWELLSITWSDEIGGHLFLLLYTEYISLYHSSRLSTIFIGEHVRYIYKISVYTTLHGSENFLNWCKFLVYLIIRPLYHFQILWCIYTLVKFDDNASLITSHLGTKNYLRVLLVAVCNMLVQFGLSVKSADYETQYFY